MSLNILEERTRINEVDDEAMTITRKKNASCHSNNPNEISYTDYSSSSSLLETLKSSLKERAEIDYKKIARIKAELAEDIYQINSETIAQELLDYMA